jgi:hypothetical protein
VSRSLGKVVIPSAQSYVKLDPEKHNDTFWFVKVLSESGIGNKGFIEVEPIQQVDPIPLIPGFFDVEIHEHWVFLMLKQDIAHKPYFIPHSVKHPFLQGVEPRAVVCIPYNKESLASFK